MSFIQQFFTSRDNNANAETFVGQEGRLWWDPVTNQIYSSDGVTPGGIPLAGGGGGNGSPGGSNGQVQFNNSGNFGGSANLTFDRVTGALTAVSFIGNSATFSGNVSADYVTANNVGSPSNLEIQSGSTYWYFNPDNTFTGTGNISAGYYIGNGSQLTGIVATTANTANYALTANTANTAITVTGNAQANITSLGNLINIQFNTGLTPITATTGQMFWDTGEHTISLGMENGVTQQIGLEQYMYIKANAAISDGQVVMFAGSSGDNLLGVPADTTTPGFRPEYIMGIATQDIARNGFGYVTTFGLVHGLNTLAFAVGDILWVDNATPGGLTNTQPSDPNFQIQMAAVTKRAGGDGHIMVRPTPFYDINRLTNVNTTSPTNGQVLTFNGANSVWINANAYGNSNVVTLLSSFDGNPISTTGNISAGYFIGNGSQLTGIVSSYGNANVVANLAALGSNPISTTGNVTAGHFVGNGSLLTSINASNVSGTVANATYATTAGSTTQLVNGSYSLVLNSDGTMAVPGNLINTGANPVGFWSTNAVTSYWRSPTGGGAGLPFQSTMSMANTGATLTFLSGTANILVAKSWAFGFNGNLTFPDATIQSTAFTGTATTAGTVTTNAQPNITSVGTLTSVTSTGNISTTGNVTGAYILGNGSQLTGIVSSYGNSNVAANLAAFGSNPISTTGNITGGNIIGTLVGNLTGTTASLSGNVTAANVVVNTRLFVANGTLTQPSIAFSGDTGQDSGFFLLSDGNIGITTNAGTRAIVSDSGLSVVGNITGANINGGANVNATTHTGTSVSVTGNINAGNVTGIANVNATTHTGTTVSVTGNINSNNIVAVGTVSATGATNGTAFAVGNSAVSNVALGMFPTAGTPGEYAIRDYSNVVTNMYFDVGIGGGAGGNFVFRGTNAFTTYAKIDSTGLNMQSLAIQGQTPYMGKTSFNVALDTTLTVDNLKYRVSNQGGVFPQIQGATGNVDVCYDVLGVVNGAATNPAYAENSGIIIGTGSWTSVYSTHGMDSRGDRLTAHITDKAAGKIYRVTFMRTNNSVNVDGYNIIVERIL